VIGTARTSVSIPQFSCRCGINLVAQTASVPEGIFAAIAHRRRRSFFGRHGHSAHKIGARDHANEFVALDHRQSPEAVLIQQPAGLGDRCARRDAGVS
jgi:hypothetical protein